MQSDSDSIRLLEEAVKARNKHQVSVYLQEVLDENRWRAADLANFLGVSREAVRQWLCEVSIISQRNLSRIKEVPDASLTTNFDKLQIPIPIAHLEAVYALRETIQLTFGAFNFLRQAENRLGMELDVETATSLLHLKSTSTKKEGDCDTSI